MLQYIIHIMVNIGQPSTSFHELPSFKRTSLVIEVLKEEIMKRRIE